MTALNVHLFWKSLLLPPTGLLVMGLVGILLRLRWPRAGAALCALSIVSVWLIGTPVVSDALARATERYPAFDPANPGTVAARAQAVVVLGGGVRRGAPEILGGDAPSDHVVLRLIETARVARAMHLPILVSGTAGEARAMRRFLEEDLQLPVRWVEGASSTTRENADFSKRLLAAQGVDRIILVTSSPHLIRAAADFQDAGFEVSPAPAEMWSSDEYGGVIGFIPTVNGFDRAHTAFYELAGRIVR